MSDTRIAEALRDAINVIKFYATPPPLVASQLPQRTCDIQAYELIARLAALSSSGQGTEESDELRPVVRSFAWEMEMKLRKHDGDYGRKGWLGCDPNHLWNRLHEEIEAAKRETGVGSFVSECADIANFAMMLADCAATSFARSNDTAAPASEKSEEKA